MQKKLIALAVAGLASTAAFAQSNVTMYGVVDMYVGSASASGKSTQSVVNPSGLAGSRLGVKGVEDLGGGLKAVAVLEYDLTPDSNTTIGAGAVGVRQQMLALAGNFGTVAAGYLQTAGYDFEAATNAFHGVAIDPLKAVTPNALISSSSRANSAVAYISPSISGLTFAVNHARLTEAVNTNAGAADNTATLLSATYANGPLTLAAVTAKVSAGATVANDDSSEWAVGGSYDFGSVKLLGNYQSIKKDLTSTTDKVYSLSGVIPAGPGSLVLGYAKNNKDAASTNSSSLSAAYLYGLSKRTTVYGGYQKVNNDSGSGLGTALLAPAANGGSASALVAGINHKF